jgi:hypothetical protein
VDTTIGPLVAERGTTACNEVAVAAVTSAMTPLKVTMSLATLGSKPEPLIVTAGVAGPVTGLTASTAGPSEARVNTGPCAVDPATVTATGPVVTVAGTCTAREVSLALVTVAGTPLKVTVVPLAAKPLPCRRTVAPGRADTGTMLKTEICVAANRVTAETLSASS